jgi:hypothetical protein
MASVLEDLTKGIGNLVGKGLVKDDKDKERLGQVALLIGTGALAGPSLSTMLTGGGGAGAAVTPPPVDPTALATGVAEKAAVTPPAIPAPGLPGSPLHGTPAPPPDMLSKALQGGATLPGGQTIPTGTLEGAGQALQAPGMPGSQIMGPPAPPTPDVEMASDLADFSGVKPPVTAGADAGQGAFSKFLGTPGGGAIGAAGITGLSGLLQAKFAAEAEEEQRKREALLAEAELKMKGGTRMGELLSSGTRGAIGTTLSALKTALG